MTGSEELEYQRQTMSELAASARAQADTLERLEALQRDGDVETAQYLKLVRSHRKSFILMLREMSSKLTDAGHTALAASIVQVLQLAEPEKAIQPSEAELREATVADGVLDAADGVKRIGDGARGLLNVLDLVGQLWQL